MRKKEQKSAPLQQARDRKLVKRILAGDERALKSFVDDYFPRLYRYARHRLNCEADVEDVVQIVLSQAARRLETFRGESTLLTWLVKICRHEISKHLEKSKKSADLMAPFLNDDLLRSIVESIESPDHCPEAEALREEYITVIQFALDQLPEHYARVLELKYVEGYNSKEIGTILNSSDEAIQSLLARARRAFKEVCNEVLTKVYNDGGNTAPLK